MADIAAIVIGAERVLKAGGYLLFEHGWQQKEAVAALFAARPQGLWQPAEFIRDYGGNWRVCIVKKSGAAKGRQLS